MDPQGRSSREVGLTCTLRGSKSRNKVSVGEPAEGSLSVPASAGLWMVSSLGGFQFGLLERLRCSEGVLCLSGMSAVLELQCLALVVGCLPLFLVFCVFSSLCFGNQKARFGKRVWELHTEPVGSRAGAW